MGIREGKFPRREEFKLEIRRIFCVARKVCNNGGVVTEKKFGEVTSRWKDVFQIRMSGSMERHWLDDNRQRERAAL